MDPQKLKIAMVSGFDNQIPVLFDSGDIPDVMSLELAKQIHFQPRPAKIRIAVADRSKAVVVGDV